MTSYSTVCAARAFQTECSTRARANTPSAELGILAAVPPSNDELVYAHSARGFALLTFAITELSRLYIQCRPDKGLAEWSDDPVWQDPTSSRVTVEPGRGAGGQKGVTGMRSYVAEPMSSGRLYLVSDAAHIVPPTGAKGLNLALARCGNLTERSSPGTGRAGRKHSTPTPTPACDESGVPSTSPGG